MLNFLLTINISYSLFFRYVTIWQSNITQNGNLPHFNNFFCSLFSSFSPAIGLSRYIFSHNLTMKFPPDYHNNTGLNEVENSFPNLPLFHQTKWF